MTERGVLALALAGASGLAVYASQPPLGWWPMALLAPALLFAAIRQHPSRALGLGTVAGLAAYLPMLVWLVPPAGFLAWLLLGTVQALFLAATAWLVRPFVASSWILLVAPVAWTGADAWRNHVPLGGFGWGSLAYAHVEGSWMLPVARVLGQHGLTLLTVLISTLLYELWRRGSATAWRGTAHRAGFRGLQPLFAGLVGALLLSVAITVEPPPQSGSIDALVVQGNDRDRLRDTGDPSEDLRIATNMLELTRTAVEDGGKPGLTVWPESAVDRDPFTTAGQDLLPIVESAARTAGGGLLAGVNLDGPRPRTFRNTALLLGSEGGPEDAYVKRHPVPFGEYLPWRSVLGGLGPLRQIPYDAVRGDGPQPIEVDGATVAAVICFESLFPHLVRDNVRAGDADLIVVSTNDASFGRSAEPAQHLAQSQLRAVETGRWVIHGALSGSSAFVDPEGVVHDRTALFELTTIRREVPLVSGATPFLTMGDVVGLGARLSVLILAAIAFVLRRRSAPTIEP